MGHRPIQSQLAKYQPHNPMDDEQLRAKSAKLWHEKGTIMVKPEWINDKTIRDMIEGVAEMLYGARKV